MTQDTRTRYIILMRHGERTCSHEKRLVGIVEDPLTPRGIQQAYMSGEWLKKHGPHIDEVFASPLQRCIDTAAYAAEPLGFARADVQVVDGLHEIDLGRWENMLLTEAQADDPEAYAAWQAHLGRFVFPDGESFKQSGIRFGKALDQIRAEHAGNLLVVAHAGVIRSYITQLRGIDIDRMMEEGLNYAGMVILTDRGGNTTPQVERRGFVPEEQMDEEGLAVLYRKYGTPEQVIRHMQKTAQTADSIVSLLGRGYEGIRQQVARAALVHDLCRTKPDHEAATAAALEHEGFDTIAPIVRLHNDPAIDTTQDKITPAEILYFADKITDGEELCPLRERFAKSKEKCTSEEALAQHARRLERALEIRAKIRAAVGTKEIPDDPVCQIVMQES